MAPSKLRKAIGAVKDRTSISLAKVSTANSFSELDIKILKATRHEEYPPDERYMREIVAIALCSKTHVASCVDSLSKRLNKTRNWTVALKTLMLIQRLLAEGDSVFEKQLCNATRRGTRLLNLSDFRDKRGSGAWDYSAYVRTYALYLDEQLEFRMHNRRRKFGSFEDDDEEEMRPRKRLSIAPFIATRDLKTDKVFNRNQQLQQLLERFLACRPAGPARTNRVVLASLEPILKDSFKVYVDIKETMSVLVERFMELDVREGVKVVDIFAKMSKQFDELDALYRWCKAAGMARDTDSPEVDQIEPRKIDIMDELIRDKMVLEQGKRLKKLELEKDTKRDVEEKFSIDKHQISALPPPKEISQVKNDEKKGITTHEKEEKEIVNDTKQESVDEQKDKFALSLIDFSTPRKAKQETESSDEQRDEFAFSLIDFSTAMKTDTESSEWLTFAPEDSRDWEASLFQPENNSSNHSPKLGSVFDKLIFDKMYQESPKASTLREAWGPQGGVNNAASVSSNGDQHMMLALPAPHTQTPSYDNRTGYMAPYSTPVSVSPPRIVQAAEMDMKQRMLVEEQVIWRHYTTGGVQGHVEPQHYYSHGMGNYHHL